MTFAAIGALIVVPLVALWYYLMRKKRLKGVWK